jgi:hypothetical protein
MAKKPLFIETASLITKNKIEGLDLVCGKIANPEKPADFLFYLIELDKSYQNSKTVSRMTSVINNCTKLAASFDDSLFEKILSEINKSLKKLADNEDNSWFGYLNAAIGMVFDEELLLSQTGKLTGYIFRQNKISALFEKTENKADLVFSDITSGKIIEKDTILLGNYRLLNKISLDKIRGFLEAPSPRQDLSELGIALQKSKALDINVLLIKAADTVFPHDENLAEEIVLDEVEKPLAAFVENSLVPSSKLFFEKAKVFLSKSWYLLRKESGKASKKIAPKTEKLFLQGQHSLEKFINESAKDKPKKKIDPDESGLRIKTNSYKKLTGSSNTLSQILGVLAGFIRIILKKENRKFVYIAVFLIALIIGYNKIKENNDKRSEIARQIELISAYDEAANQFNKAKDDILLGKTLDLTAIVDALNKATDAKSVEKNRDKAAALVVTIQNFLDEQTKTARIKDAVGFDFAKNVSSILIAGTEIYGIDPSGKIYMADTRERKTSLLGALPSDAGDFAAFSYIESAKSILISTKNNRMFTFDIDNKTVNELPLSTNAEWEDSKAIATYSSNIYILDSENGQVWKHVRRDDGYSKGTTYADTKKISIRGAIDLVIDGNLYVLQNDGSVKKFVRGALEPDFAIRGIPSPDSQILIPGKIFAEEGSNSIFVLDKKKSRILKFEKSGGFLNQYVYDGLTIESFVVNAKLQKLWVLAGGKIYEGDL